MCKMCKVSVNTPFFTFVFLATNRQTHTHSHTHTYTHTDTHTHTHTHTHARTHARTHAHTHTHTDRQTDTDTERERGETERDRERQRETERRMKSDLICRAVFMETLKYISTPTESEADQIPSRYRFLVCLSVRRLKKVFSQKIWTCFILSD